MLIMSSTDGTLVAPSCLVSNALPINDECPSSEWQVIQTFLGHTNDWVPLEYQKYSGPESPPGLQVTGRQSLRQLAIRDFHFSPGYAANFKQKVAFRSSQHDDKATVTIGSQLSLLSNVTRYGNGPKLCRTEAWRSVEMLAIQGPRVQTVASCFDTSTE